MRTNRFVRFDFCGSTVLVGSSGDQVSFNTTVGGGDGVLLNLKTYTLKARVRPYIYQFL